MLEESEEKHEETVAAAHRSQQKTVQGPQGPVANLTITKPPELGPMSDAELARAAREEGKDVELNEDNEIVDKRELLSAGLNLSAPNTRRLGVRASTTTAKSDSIGPDSVHRAAGTAASRKEINERRRKEILTQMEEQRRLETDQQRAEREANARIVVRRNDDAAIQSAVERYHARKRQKTEAETEVHAAGSGAT